MKQERYKLALTWAQKCQTLIKRIIKSPVKTEYALRQAKAAEMIYTPIEKALNKAIEKPARRDGTRCRCPDCGAGIRKSDNFCFRCGQAISHEEPAKAFYSDISKRKRGKRKRQWQDH